MWWCDWWYGVTGDGNHRSGRKTWRYQNIENKLWKCPQKGRLGFFEVMYNESMRFSGFSTSSETNLRGMKIPDFVFDMLVRHRDP